MDLLQLTTQLFTRHLGGAGGLLGAASKFLN